MSINDKYRRQLKYFRFYNKEVKQFGTVFAICVLHEKLGTQTIPDNCCLVTVNLEAPPMDLKCDFCKAEGWSIRKEKHHEDSSN